MSKLKIVILVLVSVLFIGFQIHKKNKNCVKIFSFNKEISNIDVDLKLNKAMKTIEYKTNDIINSVLIFDSKGEVITKEKPLNSTISLANISDKELYISFISDKKMAFKSISY